MMSTQQRKIFAKAPKFRFYRCRGTRERHLIPDTDKGRRWALASGATHFSAMAFNRPDIEGLPPAWREGDFYFTISDQKLSLQNIRSVLDHIVNFTMRIDPASVKVTYLGPQAAGITIPATYFQLIAGMPTCLNQYSAIALILGRIVEGRDRGASTPSKTGLRFHYGPWMDADNCTLSSGGFAISVSLSEYLHLSDNDLTIRSKEPCELDGLHLGRSISTYFLAMVDDEIKKVPLASINPRDQWRPPLPLLNRDGAATFATNDSYVGTRCAVRFMEWCRNRAVHEFRQRDILKVFDGSLKRDNGISDALATLQWHGHIRECPLPAFAYRGRRPRWFVVNPHVFSGASVQ